MAVSLVPDEAAMTLAGYSQAFVVFEPSEFVVNYQGKLLIHTLGHESEIDSEPAIAEGSRFILESLGETEESFPAYAIQGWVTVKKVKPYDHDTFAVDKELHGYGDNLTLHQATHNAMGLQAWGIIFEDPCVLDVPVFDILPPDGVEDGDLWLPQSPLHMEGFKMALQAKRIEIEK